MSLGRLSLAALGLPVLGLIVLGLAAVLLLAVSAPPATSGEAEPLPIEARPVPLRPDQPELREVEGLIWRGGLELRSPHRSLGGLSGLLISPDGARLTAVSDKGIWLTLPLRYDDEGLLAGVGEGRIGDLLGQDGTRLTTKWDRDAEELAHSPEGGLIVAFEHNHRVWRYPTISGTPRPLAQPSGVAGQGRNSGMEALTALSNGDLLAIAEGSEKAKFSRAYLLRDDRWLRLTYERDGGFRPTGATLLPEGDVLVLERRFNILEGVRIRLVRLPAASLEPGARVRGAIVATLAPPLSLDNMEGIDVRRTESGETLVYLISDDNFNPLQRTLLLVFALKE